MRHIRRSLDQLCWRRLASNGFWRLRRSFHNIGSLYQKHFLSCMRPLPKSIWSIERVAQERHISRGTVSAAKYYCCAPGGHNALSSIFEILETGTSRACTWRQFASVLETSYGGSRALYRLVEFRSGGKLREPVTARKASRGGNSDGHGHRCIGRCWRCRYGPKGQMAILSS
jgi:hypothetical protein